MKAAALLALAALKLRKQGTQGALADECEQQALRLLPTEPILRDTRAANDDVLDELDVPDYKEAP